MGSPGKRVYGLNRTEGSNPSLSAKTKKPGLKPGFFCFAGWEGAENPRWGSTGLNNCIGRTADRGAATLRAAGVIAMDSDYQSLRDATYHHQIALIAGFFYGGERG